LKEKAPSSSQPKSETDHNRSGQKHCEQNTSTAVNEKRKRSTDTHQKQIRVERQPFAKRANQNAISNRRNSSNGRKRDPCETVGNRNRRPTLENCSENAIRNPTHEKSAHTATANTTEPFDVIVVDAKDPGGRESAVASSDRQTNEGRRRNRELRKILGLKPKDRNMLVVLEL